MYWPVKGKMSSVSNPTSQCARDQFTNTAPLACKHIKGAGEFRENSCFYAALAGASISRVRCQV